MRNVPVEDRILDMCAAFRGYGYVVVAAPIAGQEELFLSSFKAAFDNLLLVPIRARSQKKYRLKSPNHLAEIHRCLPVPCFGVEVNA